jgi:hypothetical protein
MRLLQGSTLQRGSLDRKAALNFTARPLFGLATFVVSTVRPLRRERALDMKCTYSGAGVDTMRDQYSPVIRSLHRISQGAYEQALEDLSDVWRRAIQAGEKTWAAVVLWHCMIIAENMGDWAGAVEYGERVLLLQDDAYLRLFLFRAYRHLGNDAKASEHLRASVDLADETRDQTFLETLVKSAASDEGVPRVRRTPAERSGAPRWEAVSQGARRRPRGIASKGRRNLRVRDV